MEEAISGITGGISGFLSILVWYPIENFRLNLQFKDLKDTEKEKDKKTKNSLNNQDIPNKLSEEELDLENKSILKSKACDEDESKPTSCPVTKLKRWLQTIRDFIKSLKKDEIKALYKGISSGLFGSVVTNAIYFLAYKYWQKLFLRLNQNYKPGDVTFSLITSLLAAATNAILTNPIWVLNTRMANTSESVSNFEMIRAIFKNEGISGFYKGLLPSLILTINPILQYIIYEYLKAILIDANGNLSSKNIIIISAISKLITTLVTYPTLCIKTLYQANNNKTAKEIRDIVLENLHKQGFFYLYKGLKAKILQTLLNNIIVMLSYEKIQFFVRIALLGILTKLKK